MNEIRDSFTLWSAWTTLFNMAASQVSKTHPSLGSPVRLFADYLESEFPRHPLAGGLNWKRGEETRILGSLQAATTDRAREHLSHQLRKLWLDTNKYLRLVIGNVPIPLPDLEGRVLTDEVEKVLSRLHSTVSEEDVVRLAKEGYGTVERIREVQSDMIRLISLALRGNLLNANEIEHVNLELGRARPLVYEPEHRFTYVVTQGMLVDLAYTMFANYWGSGRLRECQYPKCRRIYVSAATGQPQKYCSKFCQNKAVRTPAQRERRRKR